MSLSHDYLTERSADNTTPFEHRMGPTGAANRAISSWTVTPGLPITAMRTRISMRCATCPSMAKCSTGFQKTR